MNRIKYILFGILLTIIFIPNVSAKGVEITSIDLEGRSNNTVINNPPTHSGLEMNFDIGFKEINDYVRYKVVVKNDTNIDYKISNDTSFNTSNFITYKYETTGDLKANSEITVLVTITYTKEIDSAQLVNGRYKESNKAVLKLLDKDGNIANPNTNSKTSVFIFIILTMILITALMIKKSKIKKVTTSIMILVLLLTPIITNAVETLKLTINVDVELIKTYEVVYAYHTQAFFTDEELKNYDISKAYCNLILYVGEKSENNKYTGCSGPMIKKDTKKYREGEIVNLEEPKLRDILYYHEENGHIIFDCEEISDGELCPSDITIKDQNHGPWIYSKEFITENDYTYLDNDIETMSFTNFQTNYWETDGYIALYTPGSFKMPKHDVIFDLNMMS